MWTLERDEILTWEFLSWPSGAGVRCYSSLAAPPAAGTSPSAAPPPEEEKMMNDFGKFFNSEKEDKVKEILFLPLVVSKLKDVFLIQISAFMISLMF